MELKIRNVDPKVVYAIDKIIERLNEKSKNKISRNEFLKDKIEQIPVEDLYKKVDSMSAVQLKAMVEDIEAHTDAVDKLFFLLITGDTEEALNLAEAITLKTNKNVGIKINLIQEILDALIHDNKLKAENLNNELKERSENYDTKEGI